MEKQIINNLNAAKTSTKNQGLLELLNTAPGDDKGADWWADFERELTKNRLTFREMEACFTSSGVHIENWLK